MNYATNIAIVENGIVSNIIWGMIYNMNEFPGAVQIDDLGVSIGDSYVDGVFYHNGEQVKSTAEEMADMRAALELLGVTADE